MYITRVTWHEQTDDVYVEICDVTSCCVGGDARVASRVLMYDRANDQRLRRGVDYRRPRRIGR